MLRKERLPQDVARDGGELLFVVLDPGELHFFFPRDGFFRHRRIQQNVGEQVHAESQIGLRDIERNAEAVVARHRSKWPPTASIASAICSAVRVLVPFSSTFAIKRVMPLSCGVLREKSTAKNRAHRNERQARIFAHEKPQSV